MQSLAETRAACERTQVGKLRDAGVADPENVVATIAGGLRLCKTEAFCRKLGKTVDAAITKIRLAVAESDAVERAWLEVYRAPQTHFDLYQLGEELMDLEDSFRVWRFRHVTTVERLIGLKRGTGGTGGVSYLRKMLDVVLFPEIWTLRTAL